MARPVLALVLFGCLIVGGLAQCNPETSTQGEPGAGCDPMMKRTTRKLQEADTIPGLGGLMSGVSGIGNMGQMFSRVGQFFSNMRPDGGARTARGGQEATELTPVRDAPSPPRPSRSSDRLESGRPSTDRSSRLERRDRDDSDSRGRRDTVTIPRSERGRDSDSSRSDRRSRRSDRSDSRGDGRRDSRRDSPLSDRRLAAAARVQTTTALYAPQFVEVNPVHMALSSAAATREAAQAARAAANRKIGVVPK